MKIYNNILLIFILSLSVGLFGQIGFNSQNEFEPEVIDARAEALGRTSILSSTGANFLFNNPAMLSSINHMNIQVNGRALCKKNVMVINTGNGVEEFEFEYEPEYPFHLKLNGLSFGIPYTLSTDKNLKMGFGIGYRTYYDWGLNVHYESNNSNYRYNKEFHGGFNTLVFGSGFSYQKKISCGFSLSLPFLSKIATINDYENSEVQKDFKTRGSLIGTFFTVSGSYIFSEKITLAARIRSGYILKFEDKYEFEDIEGWEYYNEITIPPELGLAIEVEPITNFKVYLEYLSRGFGDYVVDPGFTTIHYPEESDNGFSLRTGFEVGKNYLFRCGFFTQSLPVYEKISYYDQEEDLYLGMMDNKPKTEIGFTIGLGLKVFLSSLDIYSTYSFLNYNEHQQLGEEYFISGDYSSAIIKIGCAMGYDF